MDREIIENAVRLLEEGQDFVLATIVRTRGSTPREAGTSILIQADGRLIGTIGGGCAEAQVRQRAMEVLRRGLPEIMRLDLSAEVAEGEGMVCGGVMEVFLEPHLAR